MKKRNKMILWIIMLVLIMIQKPVQALNSQGNLEINYSYSDVKIANAKIYLYKVADITDQYQYNYTGIFSGYQENVNGKTTKELKEIAKHLKEYISQNNYEATYTITTNSSAIASVSNIPIGLYLILTETKQIGQMQYQSEPALLSIPNYDELEKEYKYEIKINIKTEATKIGANPTDPNNPNPTNSPTNNPNNPNQTNDPNNPNQQGNEQNNNGGNLENTIVPNTLDKIYIYAGVFIISLSLILILIYWIRKEKKKDQNGK